MSGTGPSEQRFYEGERKVCYPGNLTLRGTQSFYYHYCLLGCELIVFL